MENSVKEKFIAAPSVPVTAVYYTDSCTVPTQRGQAVSMKVAVLRGLEAVGRERKRSRLSRELLAQFILQAYWVLYLDIMYTIDHEAESAEWNKAEQERLRRLASDGRQHESTYRAPSLPLLSLPHPKHLRPLIQHHLRHARQRSASKQFATSERSVIFGEMSCLYHKMFQALPPRAKDPLLRDLPDILTAALCHMFAESLPYMRSVVELPVFEEYVIRECSYWVNGVERRERVRMPRTVPRSPREGLSARKRSFVLPHPLNPAKIEESNTKSILGLNGRSTPVVARARAPGPTFNEASVKAEELRQDLASLRDEFNEILRGEGSPLFSEGEKEPTPTPPPDPKSPPHKRKIQAWYEKGKRATTVECQILRGTFSLRESSPLISRFTSDRGIEPRPSPRMTWVRE